MSADITWERYRLAKDRYQVLGECLLIFEADRRRFSLNDTGFSPKPGYEDAYANTETRLEILRGILREERQIIDRGLSEGMV